MAHVSSTKWLLPRGEGRTGPEEERKAYRRLPESDIGVGTKGDEAITAPVGAGSASVCSGRQVLGRDGIGSHAPGRRGPLCAAVNTLQMKYSQ